MNDEQIFYRKMIGLERLNGKCLGYFKGIVSWDLLPEAYTNKIKESIAEIELERERLHQEFIEAYRDD